MKDRVGCNMEGTLIVTIEHSRLGVGNMKITKQIMEPL